MLYSNNKNGPIILVTKDVIYTFPFGYAYLGSYLLEKGEKVSILFRPAKRNAYKDFAKELISMKPLLVGFGTLYPDLYEVKELIKLLNEEGRDFPIVIGGQMVTPTPEFAVEITGADIGVIGEGEIILYELVKALREEKDFYSVKGLAINNGRDITLTGQGEFIAELSNLPTLHYDLIPEEKWLKIGQFYAGLKQPHWRYNDRVLAIHGGRGCPFNCNFCYHGSRPRYRKIEEMFEGIDDLIEKYDVNMLYFGDDLVLASPIRARELISAIKGLKRKIDFSVSCRFDILNRIDNELLNEMKQAGCRIMGLGVESGSQRILDIIDKRITVEQIIKGLKRLKDAGILPTVSIMVGQYTETLDDVRQSMDLMLKTVRYDKNLNYAFTICTPFPGTKLYAIALEKGFINDHYDFYHRFDPDKEISGLSVNLSAMTDDEIIAMYKKLNEAYGEEKNKLIGGHINAVENLRYFSHRVNNKLNKILFDRLPESFIFKAIKITYKKLYFSFQAGLDTIRLYLLGVK
jgi:anaerobic magnesium-protoporphyrin IX monomethyl ester cyclase